MNVNIMIIGDEILTPVWNSDATRLDDNLSWFKVKAIRELYSLTRDGSIAAREIH